MLYNMSNKKTFSPKKSAFSLIELSIVLIIIGLLIAGITGGASLVSSSTLRAVMGEARGYAVGVNSFYALYNALPGDYNSSTLPASGILSGTAYSGGDANGAITYATGEGTGAINHLVGTKIIDPTSLFPNSATVGQMTYVSSATAASQTVGSNLPASKSKGNGWAFDNVPTGTASYGATGTASGLTGALSTGMYYGATTENVVVLTATTGATASTSLTSHTTNNAVASLVPADLLSIDTKLDDGKPTNGRVTGTALSTCFTGTITGNTATYTTATTTKACVLAYQIDPNV